MAYSFLMNLPKSLPTEIWREIFIQIPTPWIYGIHLDNDPIFSSKSYLMNGYTIGSTQCERAALVLICKALRPLAEELLFSEVNLSSLRAAIIFSKSVQSNEGRKQGYWTKRISIATFKPKRAPDEQGSRWRWDRVFHRIQTGCPRLTTVHLQEAGIRIAPRLILPALLLDKLTTLTLEGGVMTPHHISYINSNCPSLTYLRIGEIEKISGPCVAMSFPNVRYLAFPSKLHEQILSHITFPRLEWLFFDSSYMYGPRDVWDFIHRHAFNLIGIEISSSFAPLGGAFRLPTNLQFCPSYIAECPNLQTLVLPAPLTLLAAFDLGNTGFRSNLRTLILKINELVNLDAEEYAQHFSQERFPALKEVQLTYIKMPYTPDAHGLFIFNTDLLDHQQDVPNDSGTDTTLSEPEEITNQEECELTETEYVVDQSWDREVEVGPGRFEEEIDMETYRLYIWKSCFPHVNVELRHVPFD